MARTLIYIPAWHNRIDWGIHEPAETYENELTAYMRTMPDRFWQGAELFWDMVDEAFDSLHLDTVATVKIFSDSMWKTGAEEETFIRDLAKDGSRHMQIVVKLLERGATLEVTEEKSFFVNKDVEEAWDISLEARDTAIAHNINMRLKEGETGFLILGMSHKSWKKHLDPDVIVESLITEEDAEKLNEKIII